MNWLSFDIILPELHAALGAAVAFGAYLLLPPRRLPRIAIGCFLVIVLVKEATWDPLHEVNQPFLYAGATDLFWYLVGTGIALGLIYARFRKL